MIEQTPSFNKSVLRSITSTSGRTAPAQGSLLRRLGASTAHLLTPRASQVAAQKSSFTSTGAFNGTANFGTSVFHADAARQSDQPPFKDHVFAQNPQVWVTQAGHRPSVLGLFSPCNEENGQKQKTTAQISGSRKVLAELVPTTERTWIHGGIVAKASGTSLLTDRVLRVMIKGGAIREDVRSVWHNQSQDTENRLPHYRVLVDIYLAMVQGPDVQAGKLVRALTQNSNQPPLCQQSSVDLIDERQLLTAAPAAAPAPAATSTPPPPPPPAPAAAPAPASTSTTPTITKVEQVSRFQNLLSRIVKFVGSIFKMVRECVTNWCYLKTKKVAPQPPHSATTATSGSPTHSG